jgi:hypothetical protein
MKLKTVLCHTHLMSMLLQPEKFQNAITSYTASSPDVANEGFNGYMEVIVEFYVKDLARFTTLYDESRVFPSDRTAWYNAIRSSMIRFEK